MAMPMVFLVANMLPRSHTNNLFGWTSSPSKTSLVLTLVVKPHFFMVARANSACS